MVKNGKGLVCSLSLLVNESFETVYRQHGMDLKQRGWQMALRMEKLLADGMDYLSNKGTLATSPKSWKERRRQLIWCCQLVYRKCFGRMELDKRKRYSIVNCKEREELSLLSFLSALPLL